MHGYHGKAKGGEARARTSIFEVSITTGEGKIQTKYAQSSSSNTDKLFNLPYFKGVVLEVERVEDALYRSTNQTLTPPTNRLCVSL